jgi:hypothetical protein
VVVLFAALVLTALIALVTPVGTNVSVQSTAAATADTFSPHIFASYAR